MSVSAKAEEELRATWVQPYHTHSHTHPQTFTPGHCATSLGQAFIKFITLNVNYIPNVLTFR